MPIDSGACVLMRVAQRSRVNALFVGSHSSAGTRSQHRLHENVRAASIALSDTDVPALDSLAAPVKSIAI